MNSLIISYLNKKFDCEISGEYYQHIEEWEHWWKGYHKPFHCVRDLSKKGQKSRDMYTLKMGKKVCEDWAGLLINNKTIINVNDEHTSIWLQGDNQNGGVLGKNNFWDQANDLMERMMWSGTGAAILRLKNAKVSADGKLLQSNDTKIDINYLSADRIVPISCDNGVITEAAFCSDLCIKGKNKLYLEIHLFENDEYTIENHLFSVSDKDNLLKEEELPPGVPQKFYTGSDKPWFSICKPAIVNAIDNNNGLGCAVFADAIDNLKGVDIAYNNFNSDFWLGQKKVFLSKNLLASMDGQKIAPDEVNQQLFYYVAQTTDTDGKPFVHEHNPDLRVTDNTAGIQAQLDYLSFKVGFGTKHYQFNLGSIVTATQYTGDKQDLIQTANKHFVKVESFLQQLVSTILWIGHNLIDPKVKNDAKIGIIFDQSPFIDDNLERTRDMQEVASGLMTKVEYRMKWREESKEAAEKALSENQLDDALMNFTDNNPDGDA